MEVGTVRYCSTALQFCIQHGLQSFLPLTLNATFLLSPAEPCVVNEDLFRQHNITLKSGDKIYFSHDELVEFKCATGIPVGSVGLHQRCNSGVILLPTCN